MVSECSCPRRGRQTSVSQFDVYEVWFAKRSRGKEKRVMKDEYECLKVTLVVGD